MPFESPTVASSTATNFFFSQVLLIVDHQVGLFQLARDFDPTLYRDQMIAHAALAQVFDLPVVMTTSAQTGKHMLCVTYFRYSKY